MTFYDKCICLFQGTAGVAVAGLLGAVRAQGLPMSAFSKQKIVVVGAGRYFTCFSRNNRKLGWKWKVIYITGYTKCENAVLD